MIPAHRSLCDCRILLVDDEEANLDLLEEFLRPDSYATLIRAADPRETAALLEAERPDLVLLDLHMPNRSGFEVLRDVQRCTEAGDFLPVLVLTADASPETRTRALADGAHDYLTKPLDALEVRLRVRNLLRTRLLHHEQRRATLAREHVLSVVAHDLRNPLASIAMDAEMLKHLLPDGAGESGSAESRAAMRIERTARRMHTLIEDLLEVTRIEHGTFAIRARSISPALLMAEAETMLRPLAQAKGIALSFDGPVRLPGIRVDVERLMQVFSNLVGNALKFTGPGGAVRTVWRQQADELVVSVADDGVGIPADQLPHVFRPFWQGPAAVRRSGVGLGLVITRAIIEAHGGRIRIESEPGTGTTVHFTIPFVASGGPAVAAPDRSGSDT